jgi:hypothetical protein
MERKTKIGTVVGLAISPVVLFLAIASAGAGHGNYILAFILFPLITVGLTIGPWVSLLALVQYPFYGWFIGRCLDRRQFTRLVVVMLLLHLLPIAIMLLTSYNPF